ncbi:MAG: site-2 protease family protein [Candidatus Parcubacteria bacterium]|nr:site-2 protease family protein [Candidatus Parcubacteria bacterium]
MQEINFIFFIAVLIFSVVIHEVSHGFMANILGDHTAKRMGRLTLNPIKHLDPVGSVLVPILTYFASNGALPFGWAKPVPYNPYNLRDQRWGEAKVAVAGPLSNILLAVFFGVIIRLGASGIITLGSAPAEILFIIVTVNLSLAVVNLLPIFPLDGSRVFFAFFPYHMRYVQEFMERYWLIFIAFFLLFMGDVISYLVAFFLHLITGM